MDPSPDSYLLQICLLLILILLNAFFAMSEMAVVSVNKNKIKVMAADGNKKALRLQGLLDQPNKFLSTIQVAITLAGFLASAVAATGMAGNLGEVLYKAGVPYAFQVGVVIITCVLSYITLVLGELYPKRIAMQNAEKIALAVSGPVLFLSKLTAPFVWLLSISVTGLLKLTGRSTEEAEGEYSEDEIKSILEVGQETGLIKEKGKEMIASVFEFDDSLAYEIMTPRTEVYMIDINDPLKDYVDELLEERYARTPVYDKDSDDIIGILAMKDFVIEAKKVGFDKVDIRSILKKPYFVPESKNIDDLFRDMQSTKVQMALLIDEYGGFSGLVTIEDIIEEVMGNIEDEYDDEEPQIEQLDDQTYVMEGMFDLDDLNQKAGLELESENHETIGGFLIDLLGEIPDEEEFEERVVEVENCIFTIESVKDRRIERVRLFIEPEPEAEQGEDENGKPDKKDKLEKKEKTEKNGKS